MHGKYAVIKVSGSSVAISDEPTTNLNGDKKTYQITNAAKQILDYYTPVQVKNNGVLTTGYKLNRLYGTITFDTALDRTITITGAYLTTSTAASVHEFTLGIYVETSEITAFGDEYKKRMPSQKYGTGTLKRWDITDAFYANALKSGNVVVIEYKTSTSSQPKRIFALLEQEEISTAVANPQDASVNFISTDEMLN